MSKLHNPTRFGDVVVADKGIGGVETTALALSQGQFVEFNASTGYLELAEPMDLGRRAVMLDDAASGQPGYYGTDGTLKVLADAALDEGDRVKVGSQGRAAKLSLTAITIDASVAGTATAVTQPGAASAVEIFAAGDVAGDQGRSVRVIGSDGTGAVIYEDIALDSSDTTTVVAGSTSFTKVAGAYMADGAVAGAQDITVREIDNTGVLTISGASLGTGVEVPAGTTDATSSLVKVTGPNADATYMTIFGYGPDGTLQGQRLTMDGSSPSVAQTTIGFRTVAIIATGEATNGGSFSVATVADSAYMEQGIITSAAAIGALAEMIPGR